MIQVAYTCIPLSLALLAFLDIFSNGHVRFIHGNVDIIILFS